MLNLDFLRVKGTRDPNKLHDIINDIYMFFTDKPKESLKPYKVKFDGKIHSVELESLIFGLTFLFTKFPLERDLRFDDLTLTIANEDDKSIENVIESYYNDVIIEHGKPEEIAPFIMESINIISNMSWDINYIHGSTINIIDLFRAMKDYPELKEIVNFTSDENAQFSEIVDEVSKKTDQFVDILTKGDLDTCFKDVIPSVSIKQLQEVFVNISLKPDVYGNIIEKPINTSFLAGMRDSNDYFINAVGARKALITNSDQVSTAGYLGRRLALLCINQLVDRTVDDCGTTDYFKFEVLNEKYAERFRNRYYKDSLSSKNLKLVKDPQDIIGKTLYFRSPTGCKLENPRICCKCYGSLAKSSPYHIVLLAMLELGRQFIQRLLSSKHLLQVSVDEIVLDDEISSLFEVQKNAILAKKDMTITIMDYIEEDLVSNRMISSIKIQVLDDDSDPIEYTFTDDFNVFDTILSKDSEMHIKEVPVDVQEGNVVFRINVENNEISAPLKKLIKLLENEEGLNAPGSIDALIGVFLDLLIENKITLSSVGIEAFVNQLARNPDNIAERFRDRDHVYFLGLKRALIHNPSPAIGVAFERLKQQLNNGIHNRTAHSELDIIF